MCGILLVARGVVTISKLEANQVITCCRLTEAQPLNPRLVSQSVNLDMHLPQVNVVHLSERLSAGDQSASLHRRGPDSWGVEQVCYFANLSACADVYHSPTRFDSPYLAL